jgi:hypothetical protein
VTHLPPSLIRPPFRGLAAGRWLALAIAGAVTLAAGACQTPQAENLAGLAIASSGTVGVTDAEGRLVPIDGPPGAVRRATAANGRLAVQTADDQLSVSDVAGAGDPRLWRPLTVEPASSRTPAGIDLSLDGGLLAIALGDPDTAGLELDTIDIETGASVVRSVDLSLNGPPAWLGPRLVALEVIRPDQRAGIVTIDPTTGDMNATAAEGIEPSVTRDGNRVAVVGASGVVITDVAGWLAGVPVGPLALPSPDDSTILDIALDADATRLAVVFAANSGTSTSVVIYRLAGTNWQSAASIALPGDAAVSIDWLD